MPDAGGTTTGPTASPSPASPGTGRRGPPLSPCPGPARRSRSPGGALETRGPQAPKAPGKARPPLPERGGTPRAPGDEEGRASILRERPHGERCPAPLARGTSRVRGRPRGGRNPSERHLGGPRTPAGGPGPFRPPPPRAHHPRAWSGREPGKHRSDARLPGDPPLPPVRAEGGPRSPSSVPNMDRAWAVRGEPEVPPEAGEPRVRQALKRRPRHSRPSPKTPGRALIAEGVGSSPSVRATSLLDYTKCTDGRPFNAASLVQRSAWKRRAVA